MAIDRIPGVGPTNSDIANATAAVVPNSAAITAAVPTAAQIATAVAAPSAATIAAAVAAPSAATIAAAVAAPSAATIATSVAGAVPTLAQINTAVNTQTNNSAIATAVAAAVPTLSQINTSVATNAPSSANWTYLGAVSTTGATTFSFTGLSGYKKYKLVGSVVLPNGGNGMIAQFNSDTTAGNYFSGYQGLFTYMSTSSNNATASNGMHLMPSGNGGTFNYNIENCNYTTVMKNGRGEAVALGTGVGAGTADTFGVWKSTAAITSITITTIAAVTFTSGTIYLMGMN